MYVEWTVIWFTINITYKPSSLEIQSITCLTSPCGFSGLLANLGLIIAPKPDNVEICISTSLSTDGNIRSDVPADVVPVLPVLPAGIILVILPLSSTVIV